MGPTKRPVQKRAVPQIDQPACEKAMEAALSELGYEDTLIALRREMEEKRGTSKSRPRHSMDVGNWAESIIDKKEGRWTCSLCAKIFTTKGSAKRHVLSTHSSDSKQSECPKCSSKFSRRDDLYNHLRRMHDAEDVVQGLICSHKEQIAKHRSIVSGKRADACSTATPTHALESAATLASTSPLTERKVFRTRAAVKAAGVPTQMSELQFVRRKQVRSQSSGEPPQDQAEHALKQVRMSDENTNVSSDLMSSSSLPQSSQIEVNKTDSEPTLGNTQEESNVLTNDQSLMAEEMDRATFKQGNAYGALNQQMNVLGKSFELDVVETKHDELSDSIPQAAAAVPTRQHSLDMFLPRTSMDNPLESHQSTAPAEQHLDPPTDPTPSFVAPSQVVSDDAVEYHSGSGYAESGGDRGFAALQETTSDYAQHSQSSGDFTEGASGYPENAADGGFATLPTSSSDFVTHSETDGAFATLPETSGSYIEATNEYAARPEAVEFPAQNETGFVNDLETGSCYSSQPEASATFSNQAVFETQTSQVEMPFSTSNEIEAGFVHEPTTIMTSEQQQGLLLTQTHAHPNASYAQQLTPPPTDVGLTQYQSIDAIPATNHVEQIAMQAAQANAEEVASEVMNSKMTTSHDLGTPLQHQQVDFSLNDNPFKSPVVTPCASLDFLEASSPRSMAIDQTLSADVLIQQHQPSEHVPNTTRIT